MKSELRKYRVDPREIHFIRFVVEACNGLATVTTMDAKTGLICVSAPPGREKEACEVLDSLGKSICLDQLKPGEPELS